MDDEKRQDLEKECCEQVTQPKIKHTIKRKFGGLMVVEGYIRSLAIRIMCTECMGWETHPKECTSNTCPLFPFRGKSEKAIRS